MQIKTTRLSVFDNLELKEATFRNHSFPDHFHDAYSIGIIEYGIEKMSFADKNILVHANSVIIINPHEIHSNSFFDADKWKYRIIYINSEIMMSVQRKEKLFANKSIWFLKQLIEDPILYNSILNLHQLFTEIKLNRILKYLIKNYASIQPNTEISKSRDEINEAKNFIHQNYSDKITIDYLAGNAKMDKYKFIRTFKNQTGLTPLSYLLLQRINKSKILISQNVPILQVALETGFYDQSHFTHYFKKYIGISPLIYKKGFEIIQ